MSRSAKLYLDKRNAKLLGVCAGLADYTGIELIWIRVAAIAVTLLGSGLPLLAYIIIAALADAKPGAYAE
jgi:phage shock protein C